MVAELLATHLAVEVVDVGVQWEVFLEVLAVAEALAAELAAERIDPRVHVHVTSQAACRCKLLVTLGAHGPPTDRVLKTGTTKSLSSALEMYNHSSTDKLMHVTIHSPVSSDQYSKTLVARYNLLR